MASKKAIEIQFNWIFVLVAGAAILLFFTVVIVNHKNISDKTMKATVLKRLDAIITSAGVSTDTINIIDIPNSNIEVGCNRISIGSVPKQYQSLILFSPSLIKGDKLITQTIAFNAPYKATNLLFITSPKIRYIIIGNDNLADEINKSLPSNSKSEFYRIEPQIKNLNNYKVRIMIFGDMINFPMELAKMPDSDVTLLKVVGDTETGVIEFYQKNSASWSLEGKSAYIGKSSLTGAFYADTLEMYECNIKHTLSKFNLVTKIYAKRTEQLKSSSSQECQKFYSNALPQFENIGRASSDIVKSSNFDKANFYDISNSAKLLAEENNNAKLNSCTLLY